MSKTCKKGRKTKSKKSSNDDKNDDNNNDNDDTIEANFKILNKKVLKIQNNNIKHITKSFIKNDGCVALSVY
jgi:hypothetical protein